jgi:hypothetical protein
MISTGIVELKKHGKITLRLSIILLRHKYNIHITHIQALILMEKYKVIDYNWCAYPQYSDYFHFHFILEHELSDKAIGKEYFVTARGIIFLKNLIKYHNEQKQ